MSMIVHSPRGRNRFAPTVNKSCQRSKSLRSRRDGILHANKGQRQSSQQTRDATAITTTVPCLVPDSDTCWAVEKSAAHGAPSPLFFELIALDVFLQASYYLLKPTYTGFQFSSSVKTLPLEWLHAYCETHQVHFLRRANLNNILPKQGQMAAACVVGPDRIRHAVLGNTFLVQNQAVYIHNPQYGDRATPYPSLDLGDLRHGEMLSCRHQSKKSHMVGEPKRERSDLRESRLTQLSDSHPIRLHSLNPQGKSRHINAKEEGKIVPGRPCGLIKVYKTRSKSVSIRDKRIYLKDQDTKRLLHLEREFDILGKDLDFKTFEFLKAKTILQRNALLMLAKYMAKRRNCNKVEQEGESRSSKEDKSSKKVQTAQKWDAARHQEKSSTSARKKRPTGSAGHPNDDDDLNGSDEDGDESRPPNKRRVKDSDLKFACPFYKNDPDKYKNTRSCMGPGWANVQRVKEHIFRSHCKPPFKCLRCSSAFKTRDELTVHQRQKVPCRIQDPESQDRDDLSRIDMDTERLLRSRNQANKYLTEAERWFNMYRIMFPHHPSPLSPYHSPPKDDTEDLVKLFSLSITPRFQEELRVRLEKAFSKSTIVDDIIHEAMAALRSVVQDKHDKHGKDSGPSKDSLQDDGFDDEKSLAGTAAAKYSEPSDLHFEKRPNELKSLPEFMDDTTLAHSTMSDSWWMGWFSTTSKPSSDSSSGMENQNSSLGSGDDIEQTKASAPVPQLNSEIMRKQATDGSTRVMQREPQRRSPSPDTKQSLVDERPSRCSYSNCSPHDSGDPSNNHLESRPEAGHHNDLLGLTTSVNDTGNLEWDIAFEQWLVETSK